MTSLARAVQGHFARRSGLYSVLGFGLGVAVGLLLEGGPLLAAVLTWVVGGYASVAPFAIFFIVAPSLLKMPRTESPSPAATAKALPAIDLAATLEDEQPRSAVGHLQHRRAYAR